MEPAGDARTPWPSTLIGVAVALAYATPAFDPGFMPPVDRWLYITALLLGLTLAWRLTREGSAWLRVLGIPGITMLLAHTAETVLSFLRW